MVNPVKIVVSADSSHAIQALSQASQPVRAYELREEYVNHWRDWFEINGIETQQIVREQRLNVQGDRIRVMLFALDDGGRRQVCCDCAELSVGDGPSHFKKRVEWFRFTVALHPWAEACRVVEDGSASLGDV